MKRSPVIILTLLLLFIISCTKKVPEIANSIPDHAFIVVSVHPEMIFEKGQISSMDNLIKRMDNDILASVIKDPASSGIQLSEYLFMFIYFIDDEPLIGTTAVLKDPSKFHNMMEKLLEDEDVQIINHKGYSMITPDKDDAAMAWNEKQVMFLTSPDLEMSDDEWQEELIALFELEKENAVTSIVDFNDFSGKMKDMNVWMTGDQLQKVLEEYDARDEIDINLPVQLYNNYMQVFVDFSDGAMYVNSETHLSDDVTKAASTLLVAKEELNRELISMTPGNNLLMALAFSVNIDNLVRMIKGFSPPELDDVSDQIEQATGIPGEDILDALNGDFILAVNGAEEGAALPVEVLLGIGLDDETLQEKLLGTARNWAEVEQDGDFFMINANGMELYSGIVNGTWVITNTPNYKDAITGEGLETTLADSKFNDYAGGSMGMYLNLDLTTYPAALQGMMTSGGATEMLELITESFLFMGMQGSNKENSMTLKTENDNDNSLYTILRIAEKAAANN
ncbi:MAG: DUF4836 family protein [Bacteroidales bacterium]|nr:DUF4836 family protein [Bacteroidales bacterium]